MSNDILDQDILDLLIKDPRKSYREIGKALGVTHTRIATHIRKLEDQEIIRGYTTIIDPEKLGFYSLCIRISIKSGSDIDAISLQLQQIPSIQTLIRTSGDFDFLTHIICKNREKALGLLDQVSKITGIEKTESHIVLQTHKILGKII